MQGSIGTQSGQLPPILILDGGLGTTLEDLLSKDISTPLWSAQPLDAEPQAIVAAHMAFLRAGAEVILTATYQCAFQTFERSGYSRDDAIRLMHRAVNLAHEAKQSYIQERAAHAQISLSNIVIDEIKIALSLGPFGATLSPAQEFDGFYPPPYGPREYSSSDDNVNAFNDSEEGRRKEAQAEEALEIFHLERLRVFASQSDIWERINLVAFETIPLVREVRAIRRAITTLQEELDGHMKPWWISTVYPGGEFPGEKAPGGDRLSIQEVVETALQAKSIGTNISLSRPDALGVNCTSLEYLPAILRSMTEAVQPFTAEKAVWLVVYPNRGDVYIPASQNWREVPQAQKGEGWAQGLRDITKVAISSGVWQGFIIGGCCKTGPTEINALKTEMSRCINQVYYG